MNLVFFWRLAAVNTGQARLVGRIQEKLLQSKSFSQIFGRRIYTLCCKPWGQWSCALRRHGLWSLASKPNYQAENTKGAWCCCGLRLALRWPRACNTHGHWGSKTMLLAALLSLKLLLHCQVNQLEQKMDASHTSIWEQVRKHMHSATIFAVSLTFVPAKIWHLSPQTCILALQQWWIRTKTGRQRSCILFFVKDSTQYSQSCLHADTVGHVHNAQICLKNAQNMFIQYPRERFMTALMNYEVWKLRGQSWDRWA